MPDSLELTNYVFEEEQVAKKASRLGRPCYSWLRLNENYL
jgi:hypothetical protein